MTGIIPTWSFHKLTEFEACPYSLYLSAVEKHQPEPSEALQRGLRLHDTAEEYVIGKRNDLGEIETFHDAFDELRAWYAANQVTVEENWAFTQTWSPTEWLANDAWCRMKLDAGVFDPDNAHARVIDYKTGKPNNIKHAQQGQLYAIGTFIRYPWLETVDVDFWYLDKNTQSPKRTYRHNDVAKLKAKWEKRALAQTTAEHFPPKPSKWNCRFCDHNAICKFASDEV